MESESAAMHRKMRQQARQLPITGSAHKAAIISDGCVSAGVVLAARNMAAERSGAAALDGRHDFQLLKADVAAIGVTPSGAVVAEDIRDLQHWPGHAGGLCGRFTFLALRLLWRR